MVFTGMMITGMTLFGQVQIAGKVLSENRAGIPNIHVMVYKPGDAVIQAFAISRKDGSFALKVNTKSDSLLIKTSSVQYRNESLMIKNEIRELEIILRPESKELKGVTVEAQPIARYGDTLSYLVNSFAQQNDRSVEDVLKRLPGVTVEPNGRILYQDIPINSLYVEGMDITGGNYGLISKNLPQGSVSAVEVFENHQPIKILQDVQFSSQAALNLKLKQKIATTGNARLAAGIKPLLYQFNITPFIFTKKNQWIPSLQGNNAGEDILQQNINLAELDQTDFETEQKKYVYLITPPVPEISAERYLNNHTLLFNSNSLHYLNKNLQLKVNLSLSDDNRKVKARESRSLYLPADTIETSNDFFNSSDSREFRVKFTLCQNTRENYLNDQLTLNLKGIYGNGVTKSNNEVIKQILENPAYKISNKLTSVKPLGKHLLRIGSDISYVSENQDFFITPVIISDSLFLLHDIDSLRQHVSAGKFYTSDYASMGFTYGKLSIKPELGFIARSTAFNSDLGMFSAADESYQLPDYMNDVASSLFSPYFSTELKIKKLKYHISASGKLNYAILSRNSTQDNGEDVKLFLHEEEVTLVLHPDAFWQIRINASYSQQADDISYYYPSYILTNFRELKKVNKPVSVTDNYRFLSYFSYRNQIISFFNSLSYSFVTADYDYSNNRLTSLNGSSVDEYQYMPARTYSHNINGYSAKTLSALKTTVSLRFNLGFMKGSSLLNGEKTETQNNNFTVTPGIMFRFAKWITADYKGSAIWMNNILNGTTGNEFYIFKHDLSLLVFPYKNHSFNLAAEYYSYDKKDHFFTDLIYQYAIPKPKIDLEIGFRNIFNAGTYTSLYVNGYYSWLYEYKLRPFEIMLTARFTF